MGAVETTALTGLEPRSFWAHFEALTRIPRPSRQEEPVIEHVRAWAAEHGYRELITYTQEGNKRMRAINEKLGYRERPAWILVRRAV